MPYDLKPIRKDDIKSARRSIIFGGLTVFLFDLLGEFHSKAGHPPLGRYRGTSVVEVDHPFDNGDGSLVLGYSDEDKQTLAELYERGVSNGVKGLQLLDREGVVALEPHVTDLVTCALLAPTGGIVSPFGLCDAGLGHAMDNGAEFIRNFEVDRIESADGVYTLYAGEQSVRAKYVVNCAGLYSDKIAAMVGC